MLSDSVDQNADRRGQRRDEHRPERRVAPAGARTTCARGAGRGRRAFQIAHPTRIAVITSTNGAANRSTRRSRSMPRIDDEDVEAPEQRRTRSTACDRVAVDAWPSRSSQPGPQRREERLQRLAADPRVDAEPAARDERAHQRRQVRAGRAVRGAREHRERDAVLRAGVRVEQDRHEHDQVAEQDRQQRLPPRHARRRSCPTPACTSGCSGPSRSTAPRSPTWSTSASRPRPARGRGCRAASRRARRGRAARRGRRRGGSRRPSRRLITWDARGGHPSRSASRTRARGR